VSTAKKASERLAEARKLHPLAASIFMSVPINRRAIDLEQNAKLDADDRADAKARTVFLDRAKAEHTAHFEHLVATGRTLEADLYRQAHGYELREESSRLDKLERDAAPNPPEARTVLPELNLDDELPDSAA
jgi:hypothetical protein